MFTKEGSVIIQETIQMMQGINKKLVIEGVETKEYFDALKKMSCDYIQGYFFSKPVTLEKFTSMLEI